MKSAEWKHVLCKKCACVLPKVCRYRISVHEVCRSGIICCRKCAKSVQKVCMRVDDPQKKSAKSLQKFAFHEKKSAKILQKVLKLQTLQTHADFWKSLHESASAPRCYVIPITSILGRLPLIPAGDHGTIPAAMRHRKKELFELGECDKSATRPGTGSKLYYINSWAMCWPTDHAKKPLTG